MNITSRYIFLIFTLTYKLIGAQLLDSAIKVDKESSYVSFKLGIQMSGIKNEDFVISNYSPLLIFNYGKNINSVLGLQIGYKGFYFNYIEDNFKHYFYFLFINGVIDLFKLFNKLLPAHDWGMSLYAGTGYFYNIHYKRSNICADLGGQVYYKINDRYTVSGDLSAIIGWDIYQGNLDILPSISIGTQLRF